MRVLIVGGYNKGEREVLENKGFYCYDIRDDEIMTISRHVFINNIGGLISDSPLENLADNMGIISYDDVMEQAEVVSRIEDFEDIQYYVLFEDGYMEDEEFVSDNYEEAESVFRDNEEHVLSFYSITWWKNSDRSEPMEEEYYYEKEC